MKSELKKQMEIFIAKADYYVYLASRIQACKLTIEEARRNERLIFPPDNELVRKIASETIFPKYEYFLRKKLPPSEKLNYILKVGPQKIQSLKINKESSFTILEEICFYLSIMYMNYANSDELKWLYNDSRKSFEDIERFQEMLSKNVFIARTHDTDALGKQLEAKFIQMEGYWTSQLIRIKASQKGWQQQRFLKQERIRKLKETIKREGEFNGSEFKFPRSKWESEFKNIFDFKFVSDKTKRTYKKEIEEMLSSSYGKEIKIKLEK